MIRVLPILFNGDMVRAILDGRKTVTRRCVKPKSKNACGFFVITRKSDGAFMGVYDYDENEMMFESPQTQPAYVGDILYVRETWVKVNSVPVQYGYRVDNNYLVPRWHPSIHMPKEAARIWLKVKNVRVERIKDMTDKDALNEGAQGVKCDHAGLGAYGCTDCMNTGWLEPPILEFIGIWDSTIKKSDIDRYGWDANPWVWVIEFERCEKPGGLTRAH